MSTLLQLLSTSLLFLFDPGRFRIVDSSTGTSFGNASITMVSTGLRIELTRDRSQISLRLQPRPDDRVEDATNDDDWYWIGVVRRLLDGDVASGDELDEDAIDFLERRLDGIEILCATAEARAIFGESLWNERENRAREMFG